MKRNGTDEEDDDLSELSNQEDEIEYDKYIMAVRKHEQLRKEAIQKEEAKVASLKTKKDENQPRKIIKIGGKSKARFNSIKELQERAVFEKMREKGSEEYKKFDITLSGCSATIVIQTPSRFFLAWVGDCHAVLCKKERKLMSVKLTQQLIEHTPSNQNELNRIYANRGEVKKGSLTSGDKKPRVFVRGRTYPGLSTTRSLGDLLAHHIGVTSEPSVRIVNMSTQLSERFIAIATDGIWDNMSAEDLVENINEHGMKQIGQGSEYVSNKARDLCLGDKIPLDDMTLVISYMKKDDQA